MSFILIVIACLAPGIMLADEAGERAIADLQKWLGEPREKRAELSTLPFAAVPLDKAGAERAKTLLWEDHAALIRATRQTEMDARVIELAGRKMKFKTVDFGRKGESPQGRSLFISMHGGGGAPPPVNESQWRNQIALSKAYQAGEGIYLAPRAPTDTWNLWHEAHIDGFFARLVENLIVLGGVNPNRVYILGYSAGGDGVYQVGPRMADRWAAAAMMGGHPNEASPLGLRNIGFAIQVGAKDAAYHRNDVAAEWGRKLDELQKADPDGYPHFTEIHEGKGHWMDLQDKKAVPWMEKFTRDPHPKKVVWHQDDVTHSEFYWLAMPKGEAKAGQEIVAEQKGAAIAVTSKDVPNILIRLNDAMLDLDQPISIQRNAAAPVSVRATRTIGTLVKTLAERGDPELMFSAEIKAPASE